MGSSDVKYAWPSTVNVSNFVTVKPSLNEEERLTNFNIWKKQMVCLLESQEVLGFVNGEILEPQSSNGKSAEQKLWRKTDMLVMGWILGTIGKDALETVWKLETAREVWLELEKIFKDDAEDPELQSDSDDAEDSESESDDANAPEQVGENDAEDPELQSESDDGNAPEEVGETAETERGRDLSRYLPLYNAALRGDWETAKNFFDEDKEAAAAIIGSVKSETALHVAVLRRHTNDFVKELVELMPREAMTLKDWMGQTALHKAAVVGNTEATRILVDKNPDLLYILSDDGRLPILQAAIYCHKDTLEYLLSCMFKPNIEHRPFEGQSGVGLLIESASSEFFDVALNLVDKYPDLARLKRQDGFSALEAMSQKTSVFPSGERFSWWQKLIYRRIPLKSEAAQVTSAAGDIEKVSRDPPTYKKCSSPFQIISGVNQKLEFKLWRVIEHLVPQAKGIRDKKAVHQQALQLVKCLCQQISSLPENEAWDMFAASILKAAKYGISEIVEVILETYPTVVTIRDVEGRTIFLLAANYRFEIVFNLIYDIGDHRYEFFDNVDNYYNNLMHICGKLAPADRLNLIPGAALQMQRELQWFKEAEKFVHPSRRTWANSEYLTPQMLFTKEHQHLKAQGEKWMKDTSNACTIAAALIATVVFAAAFTVPGGITETGTPIFWDQFAFILFAISDAVSLFTSVTSLLMFLSILTSRYAEEDFLYVLPKRLSIGLLSLFISIAFMMAAFSATMYLVFRRKVAWFLIPVAAFACLPITSFVLLQFPLLMAVIYSTYGPSIFGKKTDRLSY